CWARGFFRGGCFFAAAAGERGTRPGPVKDKVAAIQSGFTALLSTFAVTALEHQELPAREDPDLLAFELHALLLAADTKFVLLDDPAVLDLARQVVLQRLGPASDNNVGESCRRGPSPALPAGSRVPQPNAHEPRQAPVPAAGCSPPARPGCSLLARPGCSVSLPDWTVPDWTVPDWT